MGTTAQKLSYLNETKTKIKDKINLMGVNITDDTFRSYPDKIKDGLLDIMNNGYEKVWNNWDKVTGSGTEITLDNTEEAPMKLELKGNTSQFSTTGKNLFDDSSNNNEWIAVNGNIISVDGSNMKKINCNANETFTLSANYGSSNENNIIALAFYNSSETLLNRYVANIDAQLTITATSPANSVYIKVAHYSRQPLTIQLEKSSSATSYEPYTNGASPNPDYPQEVKVVKGDNKIKITGKNLLNIQSIVKGRLDSGVVGYASDVSSLTLNEDSFSFTTTAYWRGATTDFIEVKENTDYFFSSLFQFSANDNIFISACYDENKNWLGNATTLASGNYKRKFTTVANTKYVRLNIQIKNASTTTINNPQLEEIEATEYQRYSSEEHTISLGYENLFNISSLANNNYVLSVDGDILCWRTWGSDGRVFFNNLSLKAGTYTLGYTPYFITGNAIRFSIKDITNNTDIVNKKVDNTSGVRQVETFTLTNNVDIGICIEANDINTNPITIKDIMLEVGDTAHSYTEYGKAVQLCKINTYQDKIIGNDGSNLFDGTGWRLVQSGNGYPTPATGATIVSSDENNISFTSTQWTYAGVESGFIKVKANETYMFSGKFTTPTNRFFITQYDENKTRISTLNSSNVSTLQNTSFTTTNDGYIAIAFTNTTTSQTTYKIENIMLNKGSTALEYQPYGSGEYYKKEEVGGIVLDGNITFGKQDTWSLQGNNTNAFYKGYTAFTNMKANEIVMSDKFSYDTGIVYNDTYGIYLTTNLIIRVPKSVNDATELTTWFNTNQPKIYYPLETTNYIKITNNTLIKQLDAIKKSKNSQTNISQENDGLPFELDVSALESI